MNKMALAGAYFFLAQSAFAAIDCTDLPTWDANTVYSSSTQVKHDNNAYTNRWWTKGENPSDSNEWGVWQNDGECDSPSSSSSSSSTSSSSTSSSTSSGGFLDFEYTLHANQACGWSDGTIEPYDNTYRNIDSSSSSSSSTSSSNSSTTSTSTSSTSSTSTTSSSSSSSSSSSGMAWFNFEDKKGSTLTFPQVYAYISFNPGGETQATLIPRLHIHYRNTSGKNLPMKLMNRQNKILVESLDFPPSNEGIVTVDLASPAGQFNLIALSDEGGPDILKFNMKVAVTCGPYSFCREAVVSQQECPATPPPFVVIDAPKATNIGQAVQFKGENSYSRTAGDEIVGYHWSFHDGFDKYVTSDEMNFTYTFENKPYSSTGVNIFLEVTTASGDKASGVNVIKVNPRLDQCAGVPAYSQDNNYQTGDLVQHNGEKYHCDIGGWCSVGGWAYTPGEGTYWDMAWTHLESCQ